MWRGDSRCDACGFGNIGGFFYRDEDREGEDLKLKAGEVRKELSIVLRDEDVKLEDVVVTGIFTRKKGEFHGVGFHVFGGGIEDDGNAEYLAKSENVGSGFCYYRG